MIKIILGGDDSLSHDCRNPDNPDDNAPNPTVFRKLRLLIFMQTTPIIDFLPLSSTHYVVFSTVLQHLGMRRQDSLFL